MKNKKITQNLRNRFQNLSIQKKLLFFTIGITLVVLLSASVSLYLSASRIVIQQTRKQSAGVINELSINLDHYFEMVENSFDYIANNNTVQEELESDQPYRSNGTELYSYYSRAGQIRRLLLKGYTSVYMNDIQLYGYNGANHWLSNEREESLESTEVVNALAEEANGSCVYYNKAASDGLIYIAKQIKDSLTMEPLGILRASIKVKYLQKMTETAQDSLSAKIYLLDQNNDFILGNSGKENNQWVKNVNSRKGDFDWSSNGESYSCIYLKSSDTGFTIVSMIPMSVLEKTARELLKTTMILLLISIILCIALTSLLARGIAGPIEKTSAAMKQFAGGDFTVRLPEGRTDEIGAMNSVFNHTIEEIESLLKKVVEMETVNKDIEFQALQAQINPHFLYNVLDTINWMARKKGEENICRMVTSISNLMRASISNKKSMVTIREEMKYVEDYLYIQETRYGDKFTSYIEVDEALNEILIPKMTIQTLVENAVVHGVENATWNCFLTVSGEISDEWICIEVKDDGVGMSPQKVADLLNEDSDRRQEKGDIHTHLGIYAVRKRLDYVYNGKAQFRLTSEEGKGTAVLLKIPFLTDPSVQNTLLFTSNQEEK